MNLIERLKQITAEEYFIMGLEDYSDENNFTPVYVSKKIHETDPNKRIYNLKTLRKNNSDEWYEMEPIIYDVGYDSINAKVEFDVTKGVNRPQIIGNMIPLNTYVDEDYQNEFENVTEDDDVDPTIEDEDEIIIDDEIVGDEDGA